MVNFKRVISFILTLTLLVGMFPPVSVRAAETEETAPVTVETTGPEAYVEEESVPETTEAVPVTESAEATEETAPAAAEDTVPATTGETVPETTEETVPATTAETVPETAESDNLPEELNSDEAAVQVEEVTLAVPGDAELEAQMDRAQAYVEYLMSANDPESVVKTFGTEFIWDTELREAKKKPYLYDWSYYNGVVFEGLEYLYEVTDDVTYKNYVVEYMSSLIAEDGTWAVCDNNSEKTCAGYNENHGVDTFKTASLLLDAYEMTGDSRYLTMAQTIAGHLETVAVTSDDIGGNYVHTWGDGGTPSYALWLDGLYMTLPFRAEYAAYTGDTAKLQDTVERLTWVSNKMCSEEGLFYHASNGGIETDTHSGTYWLRSMGWYAAALADVMDSVDSEQRAVLASQLTKLADGLKPYYNAGGMWLNKLNAEYDADVNPYETSGTALIAYALLKAVNNDWIDDSYADMALTAFYTITSEKLNSANTTLTDICQKGAPTTSNSSFANNEGKGVGPYIMLYAEVIAYTGYTPTQPGESKSEVEEPETPVSPPAEEPETPAVPPATEPVAGASLSVSVLPDKTWYQAGDELDLTGLVLKLVDAQGTETLIGEEDIQWISGTPQEAGRHTVTVAYGELTAEFEIIVHTEYFNGEILQDSSGYPESSHKYSNNLNREYVYTVEGAKYLKLTFSGSCQLESSCDWVRLYDGTGKLVGSYTGSSFAGTTVTVEGDTLRIQMTTDSSVTYYGFAFASIYAYFDNVIHEPKDAGVYTAPECFTDGWYTHTCWICGESFVEPDPDSARHTYSGGFCTICGLPEQLRDQGQLSDSIVWGITENDDLYVCGTGAIPDSPAWGDVADAENLVIGEGITAIGAYAFRDHTSLETVTLPSTLTSIGDYAFYGCTALEGIQFPHGLNSIGQHAFQNCIGLTGQLVIPDTVTNIGEYVFYGCHGLTGDLTIPASVTVLGQYAFRDCYGLNGTLTIETSTGIGNSAFQNCNGLKELILNNSIVSIGNSAFSGCRSLTGELILPESLATIGSNAFYNCAGFTGELVLPEGLTAIGDYAFQNCSGFTGELVIPNGVTTLPRGVFAGLTGITSLVVGSGVTSIYTYSTSYPNYNSFGNMTGVKEVTFLGTTAPTLTSSSITPFYWMNGLETVWVPALATGAYAEKYKNLLPAGVRMLASGVEEFNIVDGTLISYQGSGGHVVIPEGVEAIGVSAFQNCTEITGLTIPETVKVIEGYAFRGCTGLTELAIPGSVETIGEYAFQNCGNVTSVTFAEGLKSIGAYCFHGCNALTEVVLPDGLTSVGNYAFQNCDALASVTTGVGSLIIGQYAFQDCTGLTTVTLGEGLTDIGANAFQSCRSLSGITFPETLQTIGNNAFNGCSGLTGDLTIPASVTSMGQYAFRECTGLKGTLTIEATGSAMGQYAFYQCTGLTKLVLTEGLTVIPNYAFYNCSGLTGELVIPESVATIGNYAFYNCSGFTGELVLPEGLTSLNEYAFRNCSGFTGELVIPNGITAVTQGAFAGMSGITSLVVGSGVTSIYTYSTSYPYYNSFGEMTGVKEVTFLGTTVPTLTSSSISPFYWMESLEKVWVPGEAYSAYSNAYSSMLPATARLVVIGADSNFVITEDGVLTTYLGEGGDVTIPAGVTAIGDSAFQNCATITSVTIPEGVTTIGNYAFYNCSGLQQVTFPQTLTSIGSNAFRYTGLTSVTIPGTVEIGGGQALVVNNYAFANCDDLVSLETGEGSLNLNDYAFYNCTALTTVTFGEGLSRIGNNAFYGCTALTGIAFPESLISIGNEAFYNCSGMTGDLTIPAAVMSVGSSAFRGCTGLNGTLTIQSSSLAISDYAFYGCSNLKTLDLGSGVTSIGNYSFYGCSGLTGDLVIPQSVTSIGSYTFRNCSGFTGTLTLPQTLTYVGHYAFSNCSGFTGELVIPNGVTDVHQGAFAGMSGIESLVIGSSVKSLYTYYNSSYSHQNDYHCFYGMTALKHVTFTGTTVPSASGGNSTNPFRWMSALETVTVPAESYGAYAAAYKDHLPNSASLRAADQGDFYIVDGVLVSYQGEGGAVVIPEGVTAIGASAFQNRSDVTSVTIPEGVAQIGEYAFYGCAGLQNVSFPESLTDIGARAFQDCAVMTGIGFPEGLRTIGNYAFSGNDGLTTVALPDSLTTVGAGAFNSCDALTTVTTGTGSLSLGDYAFQYCPTLKNVTFGEGLTRIGAYAFRSCTALTGIVLPESLTTIGEYAFAECSGMTGDLTIPAAVTSVGNYAFYNCYGLNGTLTIKAVGNILGSDVFNNCNGLTDLVLSDGLTTIPGSAFQNCSGFTGELVIPDTVTSIGSNAFYNCTGFTGELVLPEGITSVSSYAFRNCTGFTGELVIPESLTVVNQGAFAGMSGITSLVIGSKVKSIFAYYNSSYTSQNHYHCFYGMTGVTDVTFTGTNVPSGPSSYACSPFKWMSSLKRVHVPAAAFDNYAEAYRNYLPAGVSLNVIGAGDFYVKNGVLISYQGPGGNVVIPDGITKIGDSAFRGCTDVISVTVPEGVTVIGTDAFRDCTGLTALQLPESLTEIGDYAFCNCTGLTGSLTIPGKTEIGNYAFYNCTGLNGVLTLGGGETIGQYAFRYCSGLTGLELEEGLEDIGAYAFCDCTGLTGDLIIPDTVESIGDYAFCGCSGFDGNLVLGRNLTAIGQYAFRLCSGFTGELNVPDGVKNLTTGVFSAMSGITTLVFGEGLTGIYTYYTNYYHALYGMTGVKEIAFNSLTVPVIDRYTPFPSMSSLETIFVPAAAYEDYVAAFSGFVSDEVTFSSDFLKAKVSNFRAEKLYSKSAVLSWNRHTSDRVVGYRILRDGEVLAETAELTYTDKNLETGRSYTYAIYGYTAEGDTSSQTELTLTPMAPRPTDIRVGNAGNKIGLQQNTIYLYAAKNGNLDETTVAALYYRKNGGEQLVGYAQWQPSMSSSRTGVYSLDWDISTMEDGTYELVFRLTDADGGSGEYSETFTLDRSVPEKIVGVVVTGDISVLRLSWGISAELDTTVYRIYRRSEVDEAFQLLAQINGRNVLSYTDSNVKKDRIYYYYVVGVNSFGTEGVPSDITGATLRQDEEKPLVTKLTPPNVSYLSGTVNLTMTAQDNVAVTEAILYYSRDEGASWTQLARGTGSSLRTTFDTTALPDGVIQVKGVARDAAGNESDGLTYVYSIDNTGPEQVTGLTYVSTSVTATLSWEDVSDQDIHHFRLEQKNTDGTYTKIADITSTLGYNLYNLNPETEYTYRVVGYDAQGNRGIPSEDLVVMTQKDTTAPVVTRIRPTSGYYADSISISVTATDEYAVARMILQLSRDGLEWTDIYSENYTGISKSRTLTYTLALEAYEEGELYIRAIAVDTAGNRSASGSDAPYVQHIVDKTGPAAPTGVAAKGSCGYIEISWVQGSETDLNTYSVFRADSEEGAYVLLAEGLKTLNYFDRSVQQETDYWYKVRVNDLAGNESLLSDAVTARSLEDTEAPKIYSMYPASQSSLGALFRTVSVLAVDNMELASLRLEYSTDGSSYILLEESSNIGSYNTTRKADLPVTEFAHGTTLWVRATAVDISGNISEPVVNTYVVDSQAPAVRSAEAAFNGDHVAITWTGNGEKDLSCYRIYRRTGLTGSYTLFAQRQAVSGQTDYICYDMELDMGEVTYYYKVEAVDTCGNAASILASVTGTTGNDGALELPNRSAPQADLSVETTQEVGVEYLFDASGSTDDTAIVSYLYDFGDGTTATGVKAVHVYQQTGTYTVTLTVSDSDGQETVLTREILVQERSVIGTARIRVVDENGRAVAGASVYFDLGEDTQVIKKTDSNGWATFTAAAGGHTVGCIIPNNEWLPAKKDMIVSAGKQTTLTLTMVHHALITGEFEVRRMTFEEIVAAGIDVNDPENQHIVQVNIQLTYANTMEELKFNYSVSGGKIIGGGGGGGSFGGEYIVNVPDNSGGGTTTKKKLIPKVVAVDENDEPTAVAILEIPVEASILKEFFDVKLHIMNNASSEFSMLDNTVTLDVPKGLTLMDTNFTSSSPIVRIPEIKGGQQQTAHWILRGDEEGEYNLRADYVGTLAQFNETIRTSFETKQPLKVYGLSAVKLIVQVDPEITYDEFYFNLALENTSDIEVNLPSINVVDDIIQSYLREINEEGERVDSMKEVEVQMLQYLYCAGGEETPVEDTVTTLYPGERIVKKYFARNATGYDNPLFFKKATHEIAEGYGIEVEITEMKLKDACLVFDYKEDVAYQRLAEEMSLYALLAYKNSVRNNQGIWVDEKINNASGNASLGQQLKRDGYKDISAYYYNTGSGSGVTSEYMGEAHENSSPFFLAHRKVFDGEKIVDQVVMVFRGTYEKEWYGNFDVTGKDKFNPDLDTHWSFDLAAETALSDLAYYLEDRIDAGEMEAKDIKILLTGHSRGAAVANLVAKKLTDIKNGKDSYSLLKKVKIGGVYAYTFATPNPATVEAIKNSPSGSYNNIFNFCFTDDFVPNLPLEDWSWGKYGLTYWATAAKLKKTSPAFLGAVEEYLGGKKPSYSTVYSKNIVRTMNTAIGGKNGVKHYYGMYFPYEWPIHMNMYTFVRQGLGGAMQDNIAGMLLLAKPTTLDVFDNPVDPTGFTSGFFKSLAFNLVVGGKLAGPLNDTHHCWSYYSAMRTSFGDFLCYPLKDDGYAATPKSEPKTVSDPSNADPAQVAAMQEFLNFSVTDQESGETIHNYELIGWDPNDVTTWEGVIWENGNVVALEMKYGTVLGNLDLSVFPMLQRADLEYCNLFSLNLSGCENLTELNCGGNELADLNLTGQDQLVSLNCANNDLKQLMLNDCSGLEVLDCSGNELTKLDLGGCVSLTDLNCTNNFLDPNDETLKNQADAIGNKENGSSDYQQQQIPETAVFDENDVARLLAIANSGSNAEILNWDPEKPETWSEASWITVNGIYCLDGVDFTDLDLTGAAVFDGCDTLRYLHLSNNSFTELSVTGCEQLDTLWCDRNFLNEEALEDLVQELGLTNVRISPQRANIQLDAADVAALDQLVQAQDLSWVADLYATSEALTWKQNAEGVYVLTGMNLTGEDVSGKLDLTAFAHLETVNCAGGQITEAVLPGSVSDLTGGAFALCRNLNLVTFSGDMPLFGENAFRDTTATISYPFGNETWVEEKQLDYGGDLTWRASVYVEVTGQTTLKTGTSTTLKAAIQPENATGTDLVWILEEGAEEYLTMTLSGNTARITAKTVETRTAVGLQVMAEDGSAQTAKLTITICPGTGLVQLFSGLEDVTGKTVPFDLNDGDDTLTLRAEAKPEDAMQEFTWTSSSKKIATVEDGIVTFTGTPGKVKITAAAVDGSKLSASVTLETIAVPHNVEKEDAAETEEAADRKLLSGKSLTLKVINKDTGKKLTSKQITWSMDAAYAPYAKVDAKSGKLTAKKVVEKVRVEVVGTMVGNPEIQMVYTVDIYPTATHVEIFDETNTLVNGKTLKLNFGEEIDLSALVYPDDAMEKVSWKSSGTKVATVDQDGIVRPNQKNKTGTVTITATSEDGTKKATVKIQVGKPVSTVTIREPASYVLRSGKSMTLKAVTDPVKPSVSGVTWSIRKGSEYATISSGGVLKARTVYEEQTVEVVAVSKDAAKVESKPITITILPKANETLLLKRGEENVTGQTLALDSLTAGASVELSAWLTGILENAGAETGRCSVTWKTSDGKIAALSSTEGETVTVTLQKAGKATITASVRNSDGKTITAKVSVKGSVLVNDLKITTNSTANLTESGIEVASGKSVSLVAKANANAAYKKVSWSVAEGGQYASVSSSGKLTAAKGLTSAKTVKVRATAADGSGTVAEIKVTVRPIAQGVQVYSETGGQMLFSFRTQNWWIRSNTTLKWDLSTQADTIAMNARVYPYYGEDNARNAMQKVNWKSSAPKIAEVVKDAEGNVSLKIHKTGSATITATAADGSGQKVTLKLKVIRTVTSLTIADQEVRSGKSRNLAAYVTIEPGNATNKKLTWKITSGGAYATISGSGTFKAKKVTAPKQVEVTVSSQDGGASKTFSVTITP